MCSRWPSCRTYIACAESQRLWYDDIPNSLRIDVGDCCVVTVNKGFDPRGPPYVCDRAARNGHVDCLTSARLKGYGWDAFTSTIAASYGHLECLRYAHEKGCPWDEYVASGAAENGHLECLWYAHENGCPRDEWINDPFVNIP